VKRHPGLIDEETDMSWIRTHRVISFFALSYLFSWWAMILYWVGVWPEPTFIPAGPLVAAIVVIGIDEGRAGFRDLGARIVRWRVPWYWYAVALSLPLLVRFGSVLVNTGAGAPAPDWTGLAWTSFAMAFLVRLVNPMDGPMGEEPGWRGFAVPRLQVTRSPLATALILGVLAAPVRHLGRRGRPAGRPAGRRRRRSGGHRHRARRGAAGGPRPRPGAACPRAHAPRLNRGVGAAAGPRRCASGQTFG
jgi:hypothetical protein